MSIEEPTLREVPPEDGTRLGWGQTLYALLGQVGEVCWVSSAATESGVGPDFVFASRLLRVSTTTRRDEEEWAFSLHFDGGASVTIPKPGFRGAIAAGHDLTVVTDGATVLVARAT